MVQDSERTDPVLAITGERPDDIVEIDGERYPLRRGSSLTLRETARVNRVVKRMDRLERLDEPSEADEQEYEQLLSELVALALPSAPAEVRAKLTPEQRGDVGTAFFARTAMRSERARMLREATASPSGSTSSPSSPASTPAVA